MYQDFYGLRELPFELTPNPKYLFLTARHREALSTLEYGLSTAKGITVLIGEAGTGKTTLLHAALASEECRHVDCVYLLNPTLTRAEFVEMLSVRFGLSAHASRSKTALLTELETVLYERRQAGRVTALLIDEAQSLSDELLEEIRLLANTETATDKLLPLVLAGQPELRDRLNESNLRQLKQRVTLRCEIAPLSRQETAAYIAQRIRTVGGDAAKLFTREAVMLIHEHSRGIPRIISVICDNALVTGFALGRQPVDSATVLEVVRDLDLGATNYWPREIAREEPEPEVVAPVRERDVQEEPEALTETGAPEATVDETSTDDTTDNERPMFAAPRSRSRFSFFFGSR
jgi:general secretion pathway protein A